MSLATANPPIQKPSSSAAAVQVNTAQNELIQKEELTSPKPILFIQPKLTVGAPDDPYEKEADAVADKVMRMPESAFVEHKTVGSSQQTLQLKIDEEEDPIQLKSNGSGSFIQKKCAECEKEEEGIHRKSLKNSITPFLQTKSDGESTVSNDISQSIASSRGSGSTLDPTTHSFMSSRFGNDFSGVKIHTDSQAVQLNRKLNAKAFTVGKDVYFNQSQYQPHSSEGKQLLAHELTHVVQQTGGVQNKLIQRQPLASAVQTPGLVSHNAPLLTAQPGGLQKEEKKQKILPFTGLSISPKIAMGAPDDPHEKESHASSDQIIMVPRNDGITTRIVPSFQRKESLKDEENQFPERKISTSFIQKKCQEYFKEGGSHHTSIGINGSPTYGIQRTIASNSLSLSQERIQAFGFVDLIPDWVKENARNVPGYTLFTVILQYDPLYEREVERTPTNLLEGLMGLVPFGTAIFDKLREYGIILQVFDWVETQLNQLNLTTQDLLGLLEEAWNETEFPYTDAIEKVRGKLSQLLLRVENFATSLVDQIMQWIKDALIGVAEPYLEENQAWSLIKKIIRYDPLKEEEINAGTVEILEDFLLLIGKETELEQMRERGTLQQTADWLDTQLGTFLSLLGELRGLITSVWDALQPENLPHILENIQATAIRAGAFLLGIWTFATTVAEKVLALIKDALLGWLQTFALDIPGYRLLTVIIGKDVFTDEVIPRGVTNIIRGFMSLMPGGEQQFQQMQETGVIPQAAGKIETLVGTLGISWEFIVSLFSDLWNSLTIHDLTDPLPAFQRIVDKFGEPISRLFSFVINVILIVLELVLRMMNFPFEIIENILNNAMAAFENIQRDPIGFLMNMLETVKLGFTNFFGNILTHLSSGLSNWFFGQLEAAGITPPTEITVASILDVVIQVLGLSMDQIWQKLADRIGQENVNRIRGAIDRLTGIWTFIQDVQQRGMVAIWEYIQGQISNLWNMVLEQATAWIMEQVITRVVTRLLSMLDPTGVMAVINSFMAFFNAIQSAIDYFREILEIIDSYVATIAAVARGELQPGATRLEAGLASAIPVAIGFLANQVGLGNLAEKISEIIGAIRGYVDQALDWLIDRAVSMGQAVLQSLSMGEDPSEEGGVGAVKNDLEAEEQQYLTQGKIARSEAQLVAQTVLRRNESLVSSISVIDGGTTWDYNIIQRSEEEEGPEKEEGGNDPSGHPNFDTEEEALQHIATILGGILNEENWQINSLPGSTNATNIKYVNAENGRVILRQYVGVNGEIIGFDWRTVDNTATQTHRSSQTPEQKENRRERGNRREAQRRNREENDDDDGWN